MPLRLKLFLKKNKMYIGYALAILFFLLYIGKGGDIYIEREEKVIPTPISYVDSPDLFTESKSYILKEGKEGLEEVLYTLEGTEREYLRNSIIEKAEEQKEIRGTLKYTDVSVDIQNMVSEYLRDVANKRYFNLNNFYTTFSNTTVQTSKDNWETIRKLDGSFIIQEVLPLYDVNSSKAIVKTTVKGNYYDSIKESNQKTIDIYSLYDSKAGEFKILNPEYIPVTVKSKDPVVQLVEKTRYSPTHNLQLTLERILLHFPTEFLFEIDVKSSANTIFNRVKIQIRNIETKEIIFEEKQDYKEFNPTTEWNTSIFQKRIGYGTNFWIKTEFGSSDFGTIYDKLLVGDNLDLRPYELVVTPINDSFTTIDYPEYIFDL